jgi:hypothetical protein
LQAGGLAGLAVDVTLFPLDTLKTRMQAAEGFMKAGGFRGIYNGLSAAAAGSMPGGMSFSNSILELFGNRRIWLFIFAIGFISIRSGVVFCYI